MRAQLIALGAVLSVGCGTDELRLVNTLDHAITIDVHAARLGLTGGCREDFRLRFCDAEYDAIGIVDIRPMEERLITVFESQDEEECTNVVWLRVLTLGEVGPVEDAGTLLQLPAEAEIEEGAGRLHTVGFPQATIRIDEIGRTDSNQGAAPASCADLAREPRGSPPSE